MQARHIKHLVDSDTWICCGFWENIAIDMAIESVPPKNILTIGLSHHLHGQPLHSVLEQEWSTKADLSTRAGFDNLGFDLDPDNMSQTLDDLRHTLCSRSWDGVTIGWCTRGYKERTELFEQVLDLSLIHI